MAETATTLIDKETSLSEIPVEGNPRPQQLARILREPLLHFLVLGALLFGLYFWVGAPSMKSASPEQIEVDAPIIASLKTTWQMQWGRSPSPKELQKLVDNYIHDEVLYREALALGLDDNDTIVRRRLIQKMQFLTEDVLALREPDDETLEGYLAAHADRYAIPGRFSFTHIYFSQERRRDRADADARAQKSQLQANPSRERSGKLGDPSMLPATYTLADARTLANTFGGPLAREMAGVTEKGWQGPFHSAYGSHLVKVTQIEPGHPATLEEVRKNVRRDYLREQRQRLDEQFYQRLRDRYQVSIDEEALKQGIEEDEA
ncbi:MAG: peptidyl-prolyl cis-trans isomerase [Hormoscilla sp. GUM202]|nr:peptidyl-prolyl cis-trans isomerase [Hormoscilla sp. GUM202]